ncbi:ImmA/IrrE family metallo-endopeptidase [Bacillus paramycoides]|uniref:ImmA/IrrE family metallo-endopeptidase n=1 Tax=Bacillus paramycoides TaxID=2026194 RepID=UPI003D02D092
MNGFQRLSAAEIKDIEAKVYSKIGEKLKSNRILREEVLDLLEQEATLIKYPIEDDELCAFVCKKKGHIFVYINSYIPKEKQIFAAAHELYHIWFDQERLNQTEMLKNHTIENDTEDITELKANLFAAMFLVPTNVLGDELRSRGITKEGLDLADIVKLMSVFYVPYKTIVRRLSEIDFIDSTKLDEFLQIPDRDPQKGVLLTRKRLQLSDTTQDRTKDIFFEGLIENAITAYNRHQISEEQLRSKLALVKESPESIGIIEKAEEEDEDLEWERVMGDYDESK